MSDAGLVSTVRPRRERLGLSQEALADRVGVSRQAILAIERGRQAPSTTLALRLAEVLGCRVEDLFRLARALPIEATVAATPAGPIDGPGTARVALGHVEGRWVAHPLPAALAAADGILLAGEDGGPTSPSTVRVSPLAGEEQLAQNVLVAGCAPLLAVLAGRVARRFHDARVTWVHANSGQALDLLRAGMVHVAGLHLSGSGAGEDNVSAVRARFPGERMLVVNLTRWREGLVVGSSNPLSIRAPADLLWPDVRVVGREEGAGAQRLFQRLLGEAGLDRLTAPYALAHSHDDVARRVLLGAADAGVAIEGVALAHGLGFVPLAEESFDLVVPAALAERPPVSRLLHVLDDDAFRTEVATVPGYDGATCGHVTTLEAA